MDVYSRSFYDAQAPASRTSADVVVPLLIDMVRPSSVVDIGCGIGTWAASFVEHGVPDVLGVDGQWVDEQQLQIPQAQFVRHDLTLPLRLGRRFDVAVSLEVAEHLPADAAEALIDTLTQHAPVVVFSAAIPCQGGTNHINERWPSYWRKLFAKRRFVVFDWIRPLIWSNPNVCWWYAQNVMMYVDESYLQEESALHDRLQRRSFAGLDVVHPRRFQIAVDRAVGAPHNLGLKSVLSALPGMVLRSLQCRARLVLADRQ